MQRIGTIILELKYNKGDSCRINNDVVLPRKPFSKECTCGYRVLDGFRAQHIHCQCLRLGPNLPKWVPLSIRHFKLTSLVGPFLTYHAFFFFWCLLPKAFHSFLIFFYMLKGPFSKGNFISLSLPFVIIILLLQFPNENNWFGNLREENNYF